MWGKYNFSEGTLAPRERFLLYEVIQYLNGINKSFKNFNYKINFSKISHKSKLFI